MALQFTIPTIYTVVDRFTGPAKTMTMHAAAFSNKLESGLARSERAFRKINPLYGETTQQLFSFAKTAAIAGAIVGGITFSVQSMKEYESAVASFRTIVGGTDKEFAPFQKMINEVARDTKKSSIDVAASFEKIAGLNAEFAKTPEAIGAVSRAVITLSKASGDELGPSAESLVGIMNQFGFAANQADRTINVLAAGAGVGAASIVQTSEAFTNFGSVAKGANITLEQSVGLIQTLGKFSVFGSEAGTKLRGSILKLQQAGVGYKSGQFQINDALEEARAKIDRLKTSKQKDLAILKMFGAENIATGKILLNNIDTFKQFTSGVTGTNAAQEQAQVRSNTLSNALDELKAAWINMLTGSDEASKALNTVKTVMRFVAKNMSTILSVGLKIVMFFVAWRIAILAARAGLIAYNVILGISSAITGASSLALRGNIVALGAQRVALGLATAAQYALNIAMALNPVALVVIAVMALVVALGYVIANYKSIEELHRQTQAKKRVQEFSDEAKMVNLLAQKYEKLGYSKQEALQKSIEVSKKNLAADIASTQEKLNKGGLSASQIRIQENLLSGFTGRLQALNQMEKRAPKEAINPKAAEQDAMIEKLESTNNANVNINLNDPSGKADISSDNDMVSVRTTSTMPIPH